VLYAPIVGVVTCLLDRPPSVIGGGDVAVTALQKTVKTAESAQIPEAMNRSNAERLWFRSEWQAFGFLRASAER